MGTSAESPRRHRLTVENYYRMAETGILRPDERVELIEGEIIDVPPPSSGHAGTVSYLTSVLTRAVGDAGVVHVQNPVRLNERSEPQPDLALLCPRDDFYKSAHPTAADVLLIVEVAHTSLDYDRDVKIPLYARHNVPEVWLVDLERRVLTRYRGARKGGFAAVDRPSLRAPIPIAELAGVEVVLADLFEGLP